MVQFDVICSLRRSNSSSISQCHLLPPFDICHTRGVKEVRFKFGLVLLPSTERTSKWPHTMKLRMSDRYTTRSYYSDSLSCKSADECMVPVSDNGSEYEGNSYPYWSRETRQLYWMKCLIMNIQVPFSNLTGTTTSTTWLNIVRWHYEFLELSLSIKMFYIIFVWN